MPDISMCQDNECPSRTGCYRFVAAASEAQTYCMFGRLPGTPRCRYYWPIDERPDDETEDDDD